jgi:hypothetical protein
MLRYMRKATAKDFQILDIEDYVVLALLPSYLEREGSSLIHGEGFNELSNHPESGFTSTITTN